MPGDGLRLQHNSSRPDLQAARGRGPGAVSAVDVFVSYASPDAALAAALVEVLEASRLSCWIAPRDVTPGAMYADGIMRAINDAKVVALVLSEHSTVSAHVGREIERASAKHRPIIALRIDSAPLTPALEYFLSESQWVELGPGGIEAAGATLAQAIRRHRSTSEPTEPRPGPANTDVIRIGTFEISPSERRLYSGGRPVEIGARAFDLLVVLAENSGRLVSKATLLERVWRGLVVDENNLPAQIASFAPHPWRGCHPDGSGLRLPAGAGRRGCRQRRARAGAKSCDRSRRTPAAPRSAAGAARPPGATDRPRG